MTESAASTNVNYLGAAIVLALVMGGGTVAGLWTDSVAQVVLLLSVVPLLIGPGNRIDAPILSFVAFCAVAMLVQVVPLPQEILARSRPAVFAPPPGEADGVAFISVLLTHTVGRIVYACVLFVLFIAMLKLKREQLYFLARFFFVGLVFNLALAFLQYSAASSIDLSAYAAYEMQAGVFANRNHLATLLFTAIPFCVFFIVEDRHRIWAGLGLAGVLLILLATGSRAGAAIAVLAMLSSFIVLGFQKKTTWHVLLAVGVNLAFLGFGVAGLVAQRGAVPDAMRFEMARTTLSAIRENWLLGTGFGTFQQVYQVYESLSSIGPEFVNHAHNDYLEIVLEGGVLAIAALAIYLLMFAGRLFLSRLDGFQKAAGLGIFFILLHSIVDYPLRTMAIGTVFVYLNAVLFHAGREHRERVRQPAEELSGAGAAA